VPTYEIEVTLAPYFEQVEAKTPESALRKVELKLLNAGFMVADSLVVELDDYSDDELPDVD